MPRRSEAKAGPLVSAVSRETREHKYKIMGRPQVFGKLIEKLETSPLTESDIVYILSRVRKLIEIDYLKSKKKKWTILWFYCGFALHVMMDKNITEPIYKNLKGIENGSDYSGIGFENFHKEFKLFLEENKLPQSIYINNRVQEFNNLLFSIYSDVPIILEKINKSEAREIKFDKNGMYSFSSKKLEDIIQGLS